MTPYKPSTTRFSTWFSTRISSAFIRFDGNLSQDNDAENKASVKMDIRKLSAVLNHTNLMLSSAVFCEYPLDNNSDPRYCCIFFNVSMCFLERGNKEKKWNYLQLPLQRSTAHQTENNPLCSPVTLTNRTSTAQHLRSFQKYWIGALHIFLTAINTLNMLTRPSHSPALSLDISDNAALVLHVQLNPQESGSLTFYVPVILMEVDEGDWEPSLSQRYVLFGTWSLVFLSLSAGQNSWCAVLTHMELWITLM